MAVPSALQSPSIAKSALESEPIHRSSGDAAAPQGGTTAAKPTANSAGLETGRIVMALAVVIGLALFLRWLSRRLFILPGTGRSSRAIQVLSRAPLSPKQQLMLVQVGRRLIVVADSGGHMNPLCEITDADEVAQLVGQVRDEKEVVAKAFGNLFGRAKQRFERNRDAEIAQATPALRSTNDDAEAPPEADDDPAIAEARADLSGLMQKVRLVTRQFKSP